MSFESLSSRSFLGLEKCHVFITGASGAIGGEAVREFLGGYPVLAWLYQLHPAPDSPGPYFGLFVVL
jgi:hypothetical protein